VLLYESGEDVRETAPKDFPAHRERWQTFRDAGTLPMIGTFADLNGAMAVFTTPKPRGARQGRPVRRQLRHQQLGMSGGTRP
jgi:uncharacterized protein YciI